MSFRKLIRSGLDKIPHGHTRVQAKYQFHKITSSARLAKYAAFAIKGSEHRFFLVIATELVTYAASQFDSHAELRDFREEMRTSGIQTQRDIAETKERGAARDMVLEPVRDNVRMVKENAFRRCNAYEAFLSPRK